MLRNIDNNIELISQYSINIQYWLILYYYIKINTEQQ